uniref:ZP domain-containing protein n=1 Tax=Panagrolaimus sp. JU765 TaxID=591449 RepID=A0AC34R965_9BILA
MPFYPIDPFFPIIAIFTPMLSVYSLRVNSLDGPPADNAQLGDRVFHVWECATQNYAVKVYECFVHDGANRRYMLIDENGCSKDRAIMPELIYDPNLNFIYAPSPVFKFSDSNKMFFNCLLYMCPKTDPKCRKAVPPSCGIRSKRFSSLRNGIHQFIRNSSFQDLSRDQIVLRDDPMDPEALLHPIEPPVQPVIHYKPSEPKTCPDDGYSQTSFLILIFCNLITLIIATISLWTLYHRRFSAKLSISNRN